MGGGPVGGGTVVRVEGEGFDGFDNLAATAKCRFVRDGAACAATSSAMCDDGAAALGKVRVILSGNALECEAPDVGVVSDTHIQVSLNGVHFVGADTAVVASLRGRESIFRPAKRASAIQECVLLLNAEPGIFICSFLSNSTKSCTGI